MNDKLKDKIAKIITEETEYGWNVSNNLAAKIAAIVDSEMIETKDAIKRLIEWAAPKFDYNVVIVRPDWWEYMIGESCYFEGTDAPSWLKIIHDGKGTPAAVDEGLRDLFVELLGAKNDNDNHAEP